MLKTALSTAALVALATSPALALTVTRTTTVDAPPAAVWQAIGGFCGIGDWHPAVEKCALSDQGGKPQRALTLKNGGGTILEAEEARNDRKMSYSYTILDGPLPVANYHSTISVKPAGAGSKVTWTGKFKAKGAPDSKAKGAIGGVYEAGLQGIAQKAR